MQIRIKKFLAGLTAAAIFAGGFCFPAKAEGVGNVSAASAVLYEPQSGRILYEKDAHTKRAIASTTKLMTALIALEKCPPDRVITVTAEEVRVEGSALGLRAGDQITLLDLVTGLILVSGNDAANAVACTVAGSIPAFAALMNQRAAQLGMKDTLFVTPSGLDEGGHCSTAYDMALLAAAVLKNEALSKICDMDHAVIRFGNPPRDVYLSNHNRLLQLYSYAIGMKTGFTKKSGRCLVSAAEKDGVQLIAVTLNAGDDWNDHIALYNYGFSQVEAVHLPTIDLPIVKVAGGVTDTVVLTMEEPPVCAILKGESEHIDVIFKLPAFVLAPVKVGDIIGSVQYVTSERVICTMPIYASCDVKARPVAGYFGRVFRYMRMLLQDFFK